MEFAQSLRTARAMAGLTQAELGERAGVARPNIAAYEAGRRQPLYRAGVELLEATGAQVNVDPPVVWTWSADLRPFAVPSRLWRLPTADALRTVEAGIALWWSGPPRRFDMSVRTDRLRLYEVVLRVGGPSDIESIVDGLLLCEAWPELVVPQPVAESWAPMITGNGGLPQK